MKTNSKVVAKNFNLLGHFYNPLKIIFMGNDPEKIIEKCLPNFEYNSKVLIVGGGADNTVIELIKNQKCGEITHLDISKILSAKGKQRLEKFQKTENTNIKVDYIISSFLEWDSNQLFDTIIFPFYLDLFQDMEIMVNINKAKSLLNPSGTINVIDFASSEKSGIWQKIKEVGLYILFQPFTKVNRRRFPDHLSLFNDVGFSQTKAERFQDGFYKWFVFKLSPKE